MANPLIVYGAGGLGREILSLAELSGRWPSFMGFIDDGLEPGTECGNSHVLGGMEYLQSIEKNVDLLVGIADTKIKANIFKKLEGNPHINFPSLIAPTSHIDKDATIEEGCIVGHFCFVSTKAVLKRGTFLNTAVQIGHDSTLGEFCSVMPSVNISGNVTVEKEAFFGVQSLILQGLKVGEGAVVGAGSRAIKNVPEHCTVIGYPARVIK